MAKSDSHSNEQKEIVPKKNGNLIKFPPSKLNFYEQIQVSLEKADARGRVRMVFADSLIEEGLMKRRRKK